MTLYLGNNLISGVATPTEPTRNLGQIIESIVPLTDAGLHLLDGALINGSGIYSAFVDAIADLVTDYPDLFETEANWQSAVTNYGVCGKFVYDSVNNTVRLPKYNNKIYTGGGTAPVKGNGKALGLTNGTSDLLLRRNDTDNDSRFGGYMSNQLPFVASVAPTISTNQAVGISTDTTKSGIIAQLSDITTSLDGYYYIVIATTTKTEIEVDIDQVATDLNGKADVDLTNCSDTGNTLMAHNAMPSETYDNLTLGVTDAEYTAPADGFVAFCKRLGGTSITYELGIQVLDSVSSSVLYRDAAFTSTGNLGSNNALTAMVPVKKGMKFLVYYNLTGATVFFRFFYAQGSESEAS